MLVLGAWLSKKWSVKLSLLLAAVVQAVASVPSEKIDLTIRSPCETQKANEREIVVCAHRSGDLGPYRIKQLPPRQSSIPKAEMQLADGVSANAEAEKAGVGGFPSNRLMVRLKIKF
jgi:hypothetical protein